MPPPKTSLLRLQESGDVFAYTLHRRLQAVAHARLGRRRSRAHLDGGAAIGPHDVRDHIAVFGKAPHSYAYDRAGYSNDNVRALKDAGVKNVGLAPRGRTAWQVKDESRTS